MTPQYGTNNQAPPPPSTDIRAVAARVVDFFANQVSPLLGTDPQAHMPLAVFGPDELITRDIFALADHAAKPPQHQANPYNQPQQNREHYVDQQQAPPVLNMKDAFVAATRDGGMFPQASDDTVSPTMLSMLVKAYVAGRCDEAVKVPGGWKVREAVMRDYGYVLEPSWVPDASWAWWRIPAPVVQPYRVGGAVGQQLANHMAAPPSWR